MASVPVEHTTVALEGEAVCPEEAEACCWPEGCCCRAVSPGGAASHWLHGEAEDAAS